MRFFALLLVVLTACNLSRPVADDRFAREALVDLQRGKIAEVRTRVDSVTASSDKPLTPALEKIADSLRTFFPIDSTTKLIGWNVVEGVTHHAGLSYQLAGPENRWGIATIEMRGRDSTMRVIGIGVSSIPRSLEEENRFTLKGKTPAHYLTLFLALVCVAISVTAAVLVGKTPMRRRWLWTLVALIGFSTFQLNWSTGAWHLAIIHFQLLSAGFVKFGPFAPWTISFSLPIGAAIALDHRRRVLRAARVPVSDAGPHQRADD